MSEITIDPFIAAVMSALEIDERGINIYLREQVARWREEADEWCLEFVRLKEKYDALKIAHSDLLLSHNDLIKRQEMWGRNNG